MLPFTSSFLQIPRYGGPFSKTSPHIHQLLGTGLWQHRFCRTFFHAVSLQGSLLQNICLESSYDDLLNSVFLCSFNKFNEDFSLPLLGPCSVWSRSAIILPYSLPDSLWYAIKSPGMGDPSVKSSHISIIFYVQSFRQIESV